MSKKKKNLIFKCSFVIVIVGIIIGALYIKTDILKTKEQLFWKYMLLEKDEIVKILSNEDTKKYNDALRKSAYVKEGDISITSKLKLIKPVSIKFLEIGDNNEDCKNVTIDLSYDSKEIGNATFIKDDNCFFVKNDFINSNYIGFENKNLKELASTLGIENTEYIPNKIPDIDYEELLSITDSEMEHFMEKYIPICRNIVNNKDYIKRENVKLKNTNGNVSAYEVKVSEEQCNRLIIELLKALYEDEQGLEFISKKIKLLDDENKLTNINNIKEELSEQIAYFESKETKEEEILSIIIYRNEKNVIKVELVLKNNRTISIETKDNNKIVIRQYDVNGKKINVKSVGACVKTVLDSISKIEYTKDIVDGITSKVNINVACDFGLDCIMLDYNYVESIKNNVEDIIHKDEIGYISLMDLDVETCKMVLQKLPTIGIFQGGKNY